MPPPSLFLSLALTGLVGSFTHCLGMCGPLVLTAAARTGPQGRVGRQVMYHGARVTVYAVLGGVAAVLGGVFGAGFSQAAGVLSLAMGALLVAAGLAWMLRLRGALVVRPLAAVWTAAAGRALRSQSPASPILLGALNGLLPCGLVYSALLVAVTAGGLVAGSVAMYVFGLATVPVLLALGTGALRLGPGVRRRLAPLAGVLIALVGVQLILRGAAEFGWIGMPMLGPFMPW